MIKDILDLNGNIIGTLELPDSTSDEVWAEQLAFYAASPGTLTPNQIVSASIQNAQNFGAQLLLSFATTNVLNGITQAGLTIPVSDYLVNVYNYLSAGSLYATISAIETLIADTSETKAGLAPFITNDVLYTYLNKIQAYLNVPLTPNPGS